MFFLCKVEKILQGSHIILHYKHYQQEKISGDACWTGMSVDVGLSSFGNEASIQR